MPEMGPQGQQLQVKNNRNADAPKQIAEAIRMQNGRLGQGTKKTADARCLEDAFRKLFKSRVEAIAVEIWGLAGEALIWSLSPGISG